MKDIIALISHIIVLLNTYTDPIFIHFTFHVTELKKLIIKP